MLILAFATSADSPWYIVDPILSIGIGLLILRSSWGLFMRVFKVLIEGTPKHLDMYRICSRHGGRARRNHHPRRARLDDHLRLRRADRPRTGGLHPTRNEDDMLAQLRKIAYGYGLGHVTIQLEYSARDCEENHHVEHLVARSR